MGARSEDVDVEEETPSTGNWPKIQPWLTLVGRLGLAAVALWAGLAKVTDLDQSVIAVSAFRVLPDSLIDVVAYGLPIFEVLLGLLLLVGLMTRYASIVMGLLMLAFTIGIAQAWIRGFSIDCGCFGGGGEVAAGQTAYLQEILRDLGLAAVAAFVAIWPRTKYSADHMLDLDL